MLIMVIQGTDCRERNEVLTQLNHLKQPQMVTIDVSAVLAPPDRVQRLKGLLHRSPRVLNVVVGAHSEAEIAYLRSLRALFCNLHRRLPEALLRIPGAIAQEDVLVSPYATAEPDVEVLHPDEAFSECFFRYRSRRRVA